MPKKIIAIVPAAGSGERARRSSRVIGSMVQEIPKQYRLIRGQPMLRWAVKALLADARIGEIRVAIAPGDCWAHQALSGLPRTVCCPCGGPDRAATVTAALQEAQLDADDWVIVHDAARPGLPSEALSRLIDACLLHDVGGLLAVAVTDTVKQSGMRAAQAAPIVRATIARDGLWLAQTPQMFPAGLLLDALLAARNANAAITDEASALELAGYQPRLIPGSLRNFKVTWPEDFELIEKWL